MEVYEKSARMSWWLLGVVVLRELLHPVHVFPKRFGITPSL